MLIMLEESDRNAEEDWEDEEDWEWRIVGLESDDLVKIYTKVVVDKA